MNHSEQIRVGFRICGRVQGVGFRWFVLREAQQLNLRGWVRNARDGSVELEAQGTSAQIEILRRRLERGPPAARVDEVKDLPTGNRELPEEFTIF